MDSDRPGTPATDVAVRTARDQVLERFPLEPTDVARPPAEADLVSTVGHELLQPLTVIRGLLQLGLRSVGTDPERARASMQVAIEHVDRMAQLIRDLLDLAAPASGRLAMTLGPFDLATVISRSIASREPDDAARITFDRSHGLLQVRGDSTRTAQIIDNLLSNALKYGGHAGPIHIRLTLAGDRAEVRVSDSGTGITLAEQGQLFTPFFRAASARGTAGTGLGLHISRRLAERQGGRLWLETSSPDGSIFVLAVPLTTTASSATGSARGPVAPSP